MSPAPPGVAVAGPDPGLPAPVPDDGRALLAELGHLPSQSGAPEQHPPSLAGDGRKQQVNISINMINIISVNSPRLYLLNVLYKQNVYSRLRSGASSAYVTTWRPICHKKNHLSKSISSHLEHWV